MPKRIFAPAKSTITLEYFDLPAVGPTQVLIETEYSAVSPGTELAFLHAMPNTPGNYPYYPGYSACGQIVEVGQAVEGLKVGQSVACQNPHASNALIEAHRCVPLPDGLPGAEAAIYYLVSIVLQGVRKAQIQIGWNVAVLGLGPIGNLAGQVARAAGATHVEGIDPVGWRRDLAMECGYEAVAAAADHTSRPDGFEAVIEATGVPAAVPSAFDLAARLGHVVLLASTRGETEKVNFYRDVHKKGLTVFGAHDGVRPAHDGHLFYQTQRVDDETAIKLLANGRVLAQPIISDVVPPTEAAQAYERLTARNEELMLIVFAWK